MKMAKAAIVGMAVLAILMITHSASAQSKLEGVWRVSEVTITGQNTFKITVEPTHPSLFIVTKKYWSLLNIGTPTRPDLPKKDATDAQKVATWTPFIAAGGTYEVKGNTVTSRNTVAKDPADMAPGNFTTHEFKIEGDTITITPKTNQDGPIANPMITKLVRVE